MDVARPTQRLAIAMQIGIIVLGLALVIASLVSSLDGSRAIASALGAIGLSTFFTLFLVRPFDDMYKSLRLRVQLEIISRGHSKQIEMWRSYSRLTDAGDDQACIDRAAVTRMACIAERTISLVNVAEHGSRSDDGIHLVPLADGAERIVSGVSVSLSGTEVAGTSFAPEPKVPGKQMVIEKSMDKAPIQDTAPPGAAWPYAPNGPAEPGVGAVPFNVPVQPLPPSGSKVMVEKVAIMDKPAILESPAEAPTAAQFDAGEAGAEDPVDRQASGDQDPSDGR